MSKTAAEIDERMIAFVLPSIPQAVRIARFHVRAALGFDGLEDYADDAEIITSELFTNAMQHTGVDAARTIGVIVARVWNPAAVAIIVTDSSPQGPVRLETSPASERGHGLQIVEALSAHWGWHPEPGGKAVYAVLAKEGQQP